MLGIGALQKVNPKMFVEFGLDKLFKERHMWSTLTHVFPFNQNIVREFYANISADCGNVESSRFGKVFVRGAVYSFNPDVINDVFSLPNVDAPDLCLDSSNERFVVSEITGGGLRKWDARFHSTKLTCKYVVLHKVAVGCWILSRNTQILTKDQAVMIYRIGKGLPFNFSQFVFNTIMKAASDPSGCLLYPNIIFQVLLSQGLSAAPSPDVEVESLTFSKPLFTYERVMDLPYSGKVAQAGPVSSDDDNDSVFEEIKNYKGADAAADAEAGPSTPATMSKFV